MPNQFRESLRSVVAAALVLMLCSPAPLDAQQAPQSQQGQSQQGQMQQAQRPAAQANEATSTSIPETAPQPMAALPAVSLQPTATPLTRHEVALQILNRFSYGPRPGDVERLESEGISKWLSQQINPWKIDDSALDARLAEYPAMQLPLGRLMELYPDNGMIRAAMAGRVGVPRGEGERAIYDAQMERYEQRRKKGDDKADARLSDPDPLPQSPADFLAMDAGARFSALAKLSPAQVQLLRQKTPEADRDRLTAGFTAHQLEVLAAMNGPAQVVGAELVQTKILRDVFSERQLNEVMVDFWLNHFNVYVRKSQQAPYYLVAYERDVIRPRALGNFESLLVATAESPAMLNYLDNASSVGPHSAAVIGDLDPFTRLGGLRPQNKNASGLNENYARELMELHTLGVNGGYTQKDVTEVAKVFTGWTIGRGRDGGEAIHPEFDASKHEPGDKMVLGTKVKQDGEMEGMKVLHMLANSPQTARFISTKLAIRFVSDDPPKALVDRMTESFLATHGDIRHVLLAMMTAPEFFTRETYRAKVKTPQDYVLSAVRASGAEVKSASALAATISDLGMPIYGMQTPNGYSMRADPWNNTAALISRMNFALALSANRVPGVHTDLPALISTSPIASNQTSQASGAQPASPQVAALSQDAVPLTPERKDKLLEDRLLHAPVSDRTRQTILNQINADPAQQQASLREIAAAKQPGRDALGVLHGARRADGTVTDPQTALAAGLIFGSPEFQRR